MTAFGDVPPFPDDAVEVGRIVDAWGIKGGIKVLPYAADPQALISSRRWFLQAPEPAQGAVAKPVRLALPPLLKVTQVRRQGDVVVATAQELPDRNAAEALKGARVFVSRASFPTADSDEYYWVDLIGLAVVNRDGVRLGTVADLIDTGPHSVLRVAVGEGSAPVEGDERLIPFVDAYVDAVSLEERRITVDWGADF